MLEQTTKDKIDSMTVKQLLSDNRFAAVGDIRFQGDEGEYRCRRLAELRSEDNDAYVRASKELGW